MKTLGIDLGTNSLGWCLIETEGEPGQEADGRIIGIGTRIFSASDMAGRDAKSKESLAVGRRNARGMRRQRDRRLRRKSRLLEQLTAFGLMPSDANGRESLLRETGDGRGADLSNSVYALRARGLDEALEPHEIGRVLFHLSQRRGFKSNRKTDGRDNEAGKIAIGVSRLHQAMDAQGARTYGEFLHKRRLAGSSVRTRLRPEAMAEVDPNAEARGDGYDFYPTRADLEDEFDRIIAAQSRHHPVLLGERQVTELRETIFFQRGLVPPIVGKCSYNPEERRAPKAHPLFQTFRLYKEVNELAIVGEDQIARKLTPDQRDNLVRKLRHSKKSSFKALRGVLKLGTECRFNKETDNRSGMEGDAVTAALSHRDCFGPGWTALTVERQWEIVSRLRDEADPDTLRDWLLRECDLGEERIGKIMGVSLPDGYGRLGESALVNLLDAMKNEVDDDGCVITEAAAAQRVYGRTNSEDDPDRPALALLPKYQEVLTRHVPPGEGSIADKPDDRDPGYDRHMGRITNPTVHIALNQLRRVVNAIIRRHGKPDRIAIELGRELKLTDRQREEVNREIGRNTREAERRSEELKKLGQPDTGYNRVRLRLWEELNLKQPLNRVCVYSGEAICIGDVFSPEVDVDHILPYSRTLDDSIANRILCKTHANRTKRNRAPAEVAAWSDNYEDILSRAGNLPANKRWRFGRDAMARFADEEGFASRHLTDMQYASRMALSYLAVLYPAEEADIDGVLRRHSRVRALPGRMTEMLRRMWGLNGILPDHNFADIVKQKNRLDHRHHAVDAFVIACTSRALIQRISSASRALEAEGAERVLANVPEPWPGFRDHLRDALMRTAVSHKADHGTVSRQGYSMGQGQTAAKLHNDTAYGFRTDEDGEQWVVRRKALDDFNSPKDLLDVYDEYLRDTLWEWTRGLSGSAFKQALKTFSGAAMMNGAANPWRGLRRIRIKERLSVIPIRDAGGKPYKGYKGDSNYRYDVWRLPDGKWVAEVVSTFDAHQSDWRSPVREDHPTAKKVLKLQQNDTVAVGEGSERRIMRAVKFSGSGQLTLVDVHEGGPLKSRDADREDPFKYISPTAGGLKKLKARQIRIDELGTISDPGPRDT